jgi:hypothetical protein
MKLKTDKPWLTKVNLPRKHEETKTRKKSFVFPIFRVFVV